MFVQIVTLNAANLHFNNATDDSRVYDIESDVAIQNYEVVGFNEGHVRKGELEVASFNGWNGDLNPGFVGIGEEEQHQVLSEINRFIKSVKSSVSPTTIKF